MKAHVKLICAGLLILAGAGFAYGTNQSPVVNQDIELQKFRIRNALGKAVISWLSDANESAGVECERLADSLLSMEEPDVRSYFLAAQVAMLCQKPRKAIAIIEDVISKHPDKPSEVMHLPVSIVARFWVGTIARQSKDIERAVNSYKEILKDLDTRNDLAGRGNLMMICNLYLAEIESLHLKRNDLALVRLEAIKKIEKPAGHWGEQYEVYKNWAAYEYTRISKGRSQASQQLVMYPEMTIASVVAATHLTLCGLAGDPLDDLGSDKRINIVVSTFVDRAVHSAISPIDTSLVRLGYGYDQHYRKNLVEAEKYYSALFEEDSFFSPVGGIHLAQCKRAQDKTTEAENILEQVRAKYPGYESAVTELKESWKKETP